ncbi:hypothetical protein BCR33DRAFT_338309 [Rhizoclosmatium globosum]|uniref:BZIP domain-containing protein n=1 Tax=Rhizoclosmatium globosum TaxID=329046 RepID=A0A1Y2C3U4_9FUNG|nr:hypothetical protein BCR33DRAFT_338309 [Rhizoclosmatium globosum]|eukprot:ORY41710.1 hypothetical protein BCR33DRAFT_338309 [Rhizoclosmatium globosum]
MSSLSSSKRTRDDEESSVFNGSDGEAKDEEVDEGDGRSLSPELLPTSNTKKRGRKRAPGNQIERRTAQNRVAQRAFRERKMNYIKDLEAKVEEYKALLESGALPAADGELKIIRLRNKELEEENQLLKRMTSSITFDFKPPTDASDSCTRCSAERMKTLEFMRLNQTLQSRVAALEAECVRLQQSESTGNLMSLNSVPSTSDIQRIMNICQQQPGSPPLSDSLLRHSLHLQVPQLTVRHQLPHNHQFEAQKTNGSMYLQTND